MPGVPYEMEGLMENEVLPRLRGHFHLPTTVQTVVTAGIGESSLAQLVFEWEEALPEGRAFGVPAVPRSVKVRLGVQGPAHERERLQSCWKTRWMRSFDWRISTSLGVAIQDCQRRFWTP